VDKNVQSKINKSLTQELEKAIKAYSKGITDNEIQTCFVCQVELNANNLLSISLYDTYTPLEGYLYRLTDGKRLYLKDIFTSGTDYAALVNRKIREILAGESYEEYLLTEPFSSIKENQSFILSEESLTMLFTEGESGFRERKSIDVPLSQIDDYVDAADRYSGTERKKHERTDLIVRKNNIFAEESGEV
jgi:Protein of unknown function (DUF3298).